MFTRANGEPLHPAMVSDRFHELMVAADLPPVRLHDLRHGAASFREMRGIDQTQHSTWCSGTCMRLTSCASGSRPSLADYSGRHPTMTARRTPSPPPERVQKPDLKPEGMSRVGHPFSPARPKGLELPTF